MKKVKAKKINEIWNHDTSKWDREEMKWEYEEVHERTPNEDELERFIEDTNAMYLDDEHGNVTIYEKVHGQKTYVILADLGLWNGRAKGGKIIKGLWNAISMSTDVDCVLMLYTMTELTTSRLRNLLLLVWNMSKNIPICPTENFISVCSMILIIPMKLTCLRLCTDGKEVRNNV